VLRFIRPTTQAGFTLLELLIVVAILAIIGGGLLVAYDDLDDQAAEGTSAHTLAVLDKAVRTYTVVERGAPNYLDSMVAADWQDPASPSGALTSAKIMSIFPRPDKIAGGPSPGDNGVPIALNAAQLAALNRAGITHLRYVDLKGDDLADLSATITLDALTPDGTAGVVGPLIDIDIPHRAHESPRPGSGRNRGRGFERELQVGDPALRWEPDRSGGTGGYDNIKLGAAPDDVLLLFGLGNDASIVGADGGPTQLASAPVYGKIRNAKYDYGRYLLVYNVGPLGSEFSEAKLQVVLNSHGDFVDEMISEHLGQKG
jgi:prepilin-type N-terminal cleavage/methylation domain-containing protein